ncbi:MAG TPA: CHASE3 domain-containing protein, partial [Myxococcaceae bacterium]|nr:CHASE3 domain-containing protein [Myxococcaceae bacterium]
MFSRWTVGRQLFAAFLLVAVMITAFIVLTRHHTQVYSGASELVERSHKTIVGLERVLSFVKDAEAGHRDYLFSGNEAALEAHRQAPGALTKELALLRELLSGNDEQLKRVEALKVLIDQKLASLGNNIEIRRTQGIAAALASANSDESRQLMAAIRTKMAEIHHEEETLLTTRDEQRDVELAAFNKFFLIDGIAIVFVILVTSTLIGKSLERKLQTAISQVQGSS